MDGSLPSGKAALQRGRDGRIILMLMMNFWINVAMIHEKLYRIERLQTRAIEIGKD